MFFFRVITFSPLTNKKISISTQTFELFCSTKVTYPNDIIGNNTLRVQSSTCSLIFALIKLRTLTHSSTKCPIFIYRSIATKLKVIWWKLRSQQFCKFFRITTSTLVLIFCKSCSILSQSCLTIKIHTTVIVSQTILGITQL